MRPSQVIAIALIVGGGLYLLLKRAQTETAAPSIETAAVTPPSSSPTPAATPMETPSPVPSATPDVVTKTLDEARPVLQQKDAIAQSKDVHTTPKQTIDAARQLATILELQEQHPEEAARFRDFFLECARDESVITVTRAQCLDHYVKAAKLDPAAQKALVSGFPPEITRLFEALQ